jgi:hypothetical protein
MLVGMVIPMIEGEAKRHSFQLLPFSHQSRRTLECGSGW